MISRADTALPRTPGAMRIVLVSDTHNVDIPAERIPPGDLLIHAGDHTRNGLPDELAGAAAWLRSLAPRFTLGVLSVAGNHDRPLDRDTWLAAAPLSQPGEAWTVERMEEVRSLFDDGPGPAAPGRMRLLQHEAIEIGGLRIFGTPHVGQTPRRQAMSPDNPLRYEGFLRDPEMLEALFADIPSGLDVLLTHSPPLGILDASVTHGGARRERPVHIGSAALRDRLRAMAPSERPRLHVFGHEHDSHGVLADPQLGVWFVNAAAVDGDQGLVDRGSGYVMKEGYRPIVIDIEVAGPGRP